MGHLASAHTHTTADILRDLSASEHAAWIGLNDRTVRGEWRWADRARSEVPGTGVSAQLQPSVLIAYSPAAGMPPAPPSAAVRGAESGGGGAERCALAVGRGAEQTWPVEPPAPA